MNELSHLVFSALWISALLFLLGLLYVKAHRVFWLLVAPFGVFGLALVHLIPSLAPGLAPWSLFALVTCLVGFAFEGLYHSEHIKGHKH